jgi:hypothetical protein
VIKIKNQKWSVRADNIILLENLSESDAWEYFLYFAMNPNSELVHYDKVVARLNYDRTAPVSSSGSFILAELEADVPIEEYFQPVSSKQSEPQVVDLPFGSFKE